jgi:nucleoside-diphosphate-sugar epimerase
LINAILKEELFIDMTPGDQRRDFIYINDVVSAFEIVLKNELKLTNYQEFQIGSGKSFSIKHLAELIKKISNSKTELKFGAISYRQGEIMESVCKNIELIELGWVAKFSLKEGLSRIIKSIQK